MSDLVLPVIYLNSYSPQHQQFSVVYFFIAAFIYLQILSSSPLFFSSFVYIHLVFLSFLRGLYSVGLSSVFFSVLTFFHLVKGEKLCKAVKFEVCLIEMLALTNIEKDFASYQ